MGRYVRLAAFFGASVGASVLTGCGIGNLADTAPQTQALAITGTVHGGEQGISGATVQLWETGTTGYGTGAAQLVSSTTTTLHTGSFTFPTANVSANCTGGPTAYLTASGGDPTGNTTTANNHAILLAAVIGPCSTTGASTTVDINEVTTVAAAYALGNFATVTQSSGSVLATLGIGTPTTNTQGLSDAAATAILLAPPSATGLAATSSASQYLPTSMLNSLADILSVCVNASEYNVYPCADQTKPTAAGLFTLATPPGGTAPTNVFQAAMNIAKYPGNNVPALLSLISANPAFVPTVPTTTVSSTLAPNDLSLGIAYPNSTMATSAAGSVAGIAIDKTDNVWVLGTASGSSTTTYQYIGELTNPTTGAAYNTTTASTAALDGTHTLRGARFDTSGNLWIADKGASAGGVIELPGASISGAVEYTFSSLSTLGQSDYDVAVDAGNNIWTASYYTSGGCATTTAQICDYVEFPKGGTVPYTATNSFNSTTAYTPAARGLAADAVSTSSGLGNIWSTNYLATGSTSTGNKTVSVLTPSTGTVTTITLGSAVDEPIGVALDASGGGYITTGYSAATSGLYYVSQPTSITTATVASTVATTGNTTYTGIPNANTSSPASTATTPLAIGGLSGPSYDAVDGAGNVFIANYPYGSIVEYNPTLVAFTSPYYGFSPNTNVPAQTLTITAVTLVSTGTANIYYTGDTAINGQQVTFSGFPTGAYSFLNGNTYTIIATSFNYFTIYDGGQTSATKATVAGSATIPATTQATFLCNQNVISSTSTTTTCSTVGNAQSRNNVIAIDRSGTVWTVGTNGTIVGMIGTAAPTNPILAAGASGSKP